MSGERGDSHAVRRPGFDGRRLGLGVSLCIAGDFGSLTRRIFSRRNPLLHWRWLHRLKSSMLYRARSRACSCRATACPCSTNKRYWGVVPKHETTPPPNVPHRDVRWLAGPRCESLRDLPRSGWGASFAASSTGASSAPGSSAMRRMVFCEALKSTPVLGGTSSSLPAPVWIWRQWRTIPP